MVWRVFSSRSRLLCSMQAGDVCVCGGFQTSIQVFHHSSWLTVVCREPSAPGKPGWTSCDAHHNRALAAMHVDLLTCMTRTRLVQCETVSSLAYKSATLRGYLNNPFMWVIKCTVQRRGKKNILISHSQFPCSSLQVSSLFILVWFVSLPRALCVEASQM